MVNFKRLYSAVVIIDQEIDNNGDKIDKGLPNNVCGTIQFQTNVPEIEENLPYDDVTLILRKIKKKSVSLNHYRRPRKVKLYQ